MGDFMNDEWGKLAADADAGGYGFLRGRMSASGEASTGPSAAAPPTQVPEADAIDELVSALVYARNELRSSRRALAATTKAVDLRRAALAESTERYFTARFALLRAIDAPDEPGAGEGEHR